MRKLTFLLSLSLLTLTAGAALADEPVATAPETAVTSEVPAELAAQLTPKPDYKIGMRQGPCQVSVTCAPGYVVSCSGQNVCYWKVHSSWSNPGYVECDGYRTTCTLSIE